MKTIRQIDLNQDLVLELYNQLSNLDYVRKSPDAETTSKQLQALNFQSLTPSKQMAISALTTIVVEGEEADNFSFYDDIFPEQKCESVGVSDWKLSDDNKNELMYLVQVNNKWFRKTYLVNNEGYKYSRYTREIKNINVINGSHAFLSTMKKVVNK